MQMERDTVWVLFLNDMRMAHIESVEPVAKADTPEEIEIFLVAERVPLYHEGDWAKSHRKGGPLEWYNLPSIVAKPIIEMPVRGGVFRNVEAIPNVASLRSRS